MWPFGKKKDAQNERGNTQNSPLGSERASEVAPATSARAEMLWKAGSLYLRRKQYLKAIASLLEAHDLEPSRLEGRLNLGAALYMAQRPGEALEHLKYVLAFEPQNTIALLNLAATYDALGQTDNAIDTLEKLVKDRPNWADANYNLGVAYVKQDRLEDATLALRRELTLNPKHDAARTLLNEVHLKPRRKPKPATPPESEMGITATSESETSSETAIEPPALQLTSGSETETASKTEVTPEAETEVISGAQTGLKTEIASQSEIALEAETDTYSKIIPAAAIAPDSRPEPRPE